ncbi:hypothetical protein Tco_0913872, partial [Tanacetum coccineum]
KKDFHISQASGSGDGTDLESGIPNEQQSKTSGTDEGTDDYDDDSDDDSKGDDDGNSDADDNERTDSDDDDENPSFTLKEYDKEEHDKEYKSNDDYENMFEEEDDPYEQVIEDAHVTLTSLQKTKSSKQSSSVSSDFASKFLILENVPQTIDEVASMMNVKSHQEESSTQAPSIFTIPETAIPKTATTHATIVPPTISMITPLPQLMTPTPAPITASTTTLISALPDFSSLFGFDQRVSTLETELSQLKQADLSAQVLKFVKSQLPTMIDELLSTRIRYATRTALESYTKEFEKKAQEERKLYIDVVEKSVKDIIKDEVKTTSLVDFELKKILIDKLEKNKSYRAAEEHKNLYDALNKSYQPDKDLFDSYDSQSSSSKGTKSQSKSSGKSGQAEELVFETADTEMSHDQRDDMGNTEDQPNVETTSKHDWFKKPERPPTPDPDWNVGKQIDFRPPHTWINQIAKAEKLILSFDELMSTPIDFSAFFMNHLKIDNLT